MQVLIVGIIDTLIPFNGRKKAEYAYKTFRHPGKNFSVIPPKSYEVRFVEYLHKLIRSETEQHINATLSIGLEVEDIAFQLDAEYANDLFEKDFRRENFDEDSANGSK